MLHIPKTADKAVDALATASALVTAKEWERAAIVAALVGPAPGKPGRPGKDQKWSFTRDGLAAKGIVGLSSPTTVERYRDAWATTGRDFPTLGDLLDLDGLDEWPPTRTGTDGYSSEQGAEATIAKIVAKHGPQVLAKAVTPEVVADAIVADPKVADAAAEGLMRSAHPGVGKSPTSPESKAANARAVARDLAAESIGRRISEASELMRLAEQAWEANGHDLSNDDRRGIKVSLTEIIVKAETLRMEMALDDEGAQS